MMSMFTEPTTRTEAGPELNEPAAAAAGDDDGDEEDAPWQLHGRKGCMSPGS
jgi:hypothetical protein